MAQHLGNSVHRGVTQTAHESCTAKQPLME
jgi:hypothetical protein